METKYRDIADGNHLLFWNADIISVLLETKYRDIADGNPFKTISRLAPSILLETKYRDIADGNGGRPLLVVTAAGAGWKPSTAI